MAVLEVVAIIEYVTTAPGRARLGGEVPPAVSRREAEVLRLIAERYGNDEIARRLGISKRTVESHVSALYRKMMVTDRVALAQSAVALTRGADGAPDPRPHPARTARDRADVVAARLEATRQRARIVHQLAALVHETSAVLQMGMIELIAAIRDYNAP